MSKRRMTVLGRSAPAVRPTLLAAGLLATLFSAPVSVMLVLSMLFGGQ